MEIVPPMGRRFPNRRTPERRSSTQERAIGNRLSSGAAVSQPPDSGATIQHRRTGDRKSPLLWGGGFPTAGLRSDDPAPKNGRSEISPPMGRRFPNRRTPERRSSTQERAIGNLPSYGAAVSQPPNSEMTIFHRRTGDRKSPLLAPPQPPPTVVIARLARLNFSDSQC